MSAPFEVVFDDPLLDSLATCRGYRILDRYVIYAYINEGGMGAVFRAVHHSLHLDVAVKVALVDPTFTRSTDEFVQEAKRLAELRHPHIVQCLDVGRIGARPFMIVEHVSGWDAKQRVERRGRLSPHEAATVVWRAAQAIGFMHGRGTVHRDLTPDNVMLSTGGEIKVADLGIARPIGEEFSTGRIDVVGKPRYLPIEYLTGRVTRAPTINVYSLGATLFYLLVGRPGIDLTASSDESLALMVISALHGKGHPRLREALPEISEELAAIVDRATSASASDRYPTGKEMGAALGAWLSSNGGPADLADPDAGRKTLEAQAAGRPSDALLNAIDRDRIKQSDLPPKPTAKPVSKSVPIVSPAELVEFSNRQRELRKGRLLHRAQEDLPTKFKVFAAISVLLLSAFSVSLYWNRSPSPRPIDPPPAHVRIPRPRLVAPIEKATVTVDAPSAVVCELDFDGDELPSVFVTVDGKPVLDLATKKDLALPKMPTGRHVVVVEVGRQGGDEPRQRTQFIVLVDDGLAPQIESHPDLGENHAIGLPFTPTIRAHDGSVLDWIVEFDGKIVEMTDAPEKVGDSWVWTGKPVTPDKAGRRKLHVIVRDVAGREDAREFPVDVDDGKEPRDLLLDHVRFDARPGSELKITGTVRESLPKARLVFDPPLATDDANFDPEDENGVRRWSVNVTCPTPPDSAGAADGSAPFEYRLYVCDELGAVSAAAPFVIAVDAVPPAMQLVDLARIDRTVSVSTSIDGASTVSGALYRADETESLSSFIVEPGPTGLVTWVSEALPDGVYYVVLKASDNAGNQAASTSKALRIDRSPPEIVWVDASNLLTLSNESRPGLPSTIPVRLAVSVKITDALPTKVALTLEDLPLGGVRDVPAGLQMPIDVPIDVSSYPPGKTMFKIVVTAEELREPGDGEPLSSKSKRFVSVPVRRWVPEWASLDEQPDFDPETGLARNVVHKGTGIKMRLVAGGVLRRTPRPEMARIADRDGVAVEADAVNDLYVAVRETSRAEYSKLAAASAGPSADDHLPVTNLSPSQIMQRLGTPASEALRLPLDREWEYVCRRQRDGSSTPGLFATGDLLMRERAHFNQSMGDAVPDGLAGGASSEEAVAGALLPTDKGVDETGGWFLHLHGNVDEICVSSTTKKDEATQFVLCGGSHQSRARDCRAARREPVSSGLVSKVVGFRLVADRPEYSPKLLVR